MEITVINAKQFSMTIVDVSMVYSIWGAGRLDRKNLRLALEVSDAFEPVLAEHGSTLRSSNAQNGNVASDAISSLLKSLATITLSAPAFELLVAEVSEHKGWTMRLARQLKRIEDAFAAARDVTLSPDAKEG